MSIPFQDTVGGRRFLEGTVPALVRALERIATQMEEDAKPKIEIADTSPQLQKLMDIVKESRTEEYIDTGEVIEAIAELGESLGLKVQEVDEP